jgi:hypothetical protein
MNSNTPIITNTNNTPSKYPNLNSTPANYQPNLYTPPGFLFGQNNNQNTAIRINPQTSEPSFLAQALLGNNNTSEV